MINRKEILFFKEHKSFSFPKLVQLEITRECTLNCPQCYKFDIEKKHMDYARLKDILNIIKEENVELITLNGGEPLLYPNILDLINEVKKLGCQVNIFTSGIGLNDEFISQLKGSHNISMYVSLNGSNEKINSLSRDGYIYAIKALKKLYNSNCLYGINWVARHDNVKDFKNLLMLAEEYNASSILITSNKVTGKHTMQSLLSYEDYICLADIINNRESTKVNLQIESCFSQLSTLIKFDHKLFLGHCYAGISSCNINYDFTFQPCTHLPCPEKFSSIYEYWYDSKILKVLRENPPHTLHPCINCNNSSRCSFCRATSLSTQENLNKGLEDCILFESNRCI